MVERCQGPATFHDWFSTNTNLGASYIHASSHESVFCLLYIIHLQDITTSKLNFIKWLTMLKEIHRKANSGGLHSGFSGFLLACWLHNAQGPVRNISQLTVIIDGLNVLSFSPKQIV